MNTPSRSTSQTPQQQATGRPNDLRARFEQACLQGQRPRLEDVLATCPAAQSSELFRQLLAIELAWRKQAGERPSAEEYLRRFPEQAQVIAAAITLAGTSATPLLAELAQSEEDGPITRAFTIPPQLAPLPERFGGFRVVRLLHQDSLGTVYLAHDPNLNRSVTVKVPRFGPTDHAAAVERFLRAARAAATVQHPSLVPILAVGQVEGTPYLALPFLEGQTLAQRLGNGPLAVPEATLLTARLADGLHAAHQKGVLLRNLTPANVMVLLGGEPVLLDFSLARQEGSNHLTTDGQMLGTPGYIAPEMLSGKVGHDTPASDIFGLGVLLYECLTGHLPFGRTLREVTHRLLTQKPEPPSALRPEVPPTLDAICQKALACQPGARYGSMAALAADLRSLLQFSPEIAKSRKEGREMVGADQQGGSRAAQPGASSVKGVAAGHVLSKRLDKQLSAAVSKKPGRRRKRFLWVGAILGTLLLAFVGLWAGGVFRVKTAEGRILVVEVNEPNPDVFVDGEKVDGKRILSGSGDKTVKVWNADKGQEVLSLKGHTASVRSVCFSPDGKRILSGSDDKTVKVWDADKGQEVLSLKGHSDWVYSVCFSPDGKRILSGSRDTTMKVWDADKGQEVLSLKGHTAPVNSVCFSPDGKRLLSGSDDGTVLLWTATVLRRADIPEAVLAPVGRGTPPRGLSDEAWLQRIKNLASGNVLDAVSDRLRELNPGFDRPVSPVIEDGVVTELRFSCPNVKNISPLRALPGLRRLVCVEGTLTDLSPLKDMKLTALQIESTQVSDLSPLKDMKLTILYCGNTKVSDLTPLKDMKPSHLGCNGTPVSDLTPLRDMKLTALYCGNTKVSDLTPLKDMKLTHLYCASTPVSDLTPLKDMKLTYLGCWDTPVSDLTPLKDMKLTILYCGNTKVSDLTPLKDMKLTVLHCKYTSVSDLSPLRDMKLTELHCEMAQVTGAGLAGLQEMSSLRRLEIGGPKMTDVGLEHLKKLTDLELLTLYNSKLTGTGLVHLKGMTKLQVLDLNRTEVTDEGLVHVKGLLGLRELRLEQTRVTDAGLEHLAGLKDLAQLRLNGTTVTDKGIAMLKAALPRCNISR